MKISVKKYAQALALSLEEDRSKAVEKIRDFLLFLQVKKKGKLIKRLPSVFREIWLDKNNQMEVKVTFPYEPKEAEVSDFAEVLSKAMDKEVLIEADVDEKIIGGVKLEFGEYVVDGTVLKNLEILKSKLIS